MGSQEILTNIKKKIKNYKYEHLRLLMGEKNFTYLFII